VFLHVSTASEDWCEEAVASYEKKIGHFVSFEVVALKPKKAGRGQQTFKVQAEAESILAFLKDGDELVVFDERGKSLTSEKFAQNIQSLYESGKKRVVFVIGGAYGLDSQLVKKAKSQISLAPFVMNHLVAQVVALEQIYRSFTIIRGLPYHNS